MATHFHGVHRVKLGLSGKDRRHPLGKGVAQLDHLLIWGDLVRTTLRGIFWLNSHDLINDLFTLIDLEVDIGILVHAEDFRVVFIRQLLDIFLITV